MIKITEYGSRFEYTLKGKLHRPNRPAVLWKDGDWAWWLHAQPHRYYGPVNNYGDWWVHGWRAK